MKITALLATTALIALLSLPAQARIQDQPTPKGVWLGREDGAARTPPMGWNSWNAFRTQVDETKVMGAAQALIDDGLAKLGYTYVNLDDGWWLKRRQPDGRSTRGLTAGRR